MLPYGRMPVYGNNTQGWYSGTGVVMAFDSTNFSPVTISTTFNDYKGVAITGDYQNGGYVLPFKNTNGNNSTYGPGIQLGSGLLAAANSQIPASLVGTGYTVDFWYAQTSTSNIEVVPWGWYLTVANNNPKWQGWYNGSVQRMINNGSSFDRTLYSNFYNTTWKHYAYVYTGTSTHTHYVFVNGTIIDTYTNTITVPTGATRFGVGGHVNSTGSTINSIIERFRVHNYARWTANFTASDANLYP